MTNDKITVSRELLRQTIDLLDDMLAPGATFSTDALRAALEQPGVETVAWVWNPAKESLERVHVFGHWQSGAIYAFGPEAPQPQQPAPVQEQQPVAWVNQANLASASIERTRCGQGDTHTWSETRTTYHSVPLYTAPQPDRIAQLEAANTNLFEQGQKMHKRIQELEAAPVQGASHDVVAGAIFDFAGFLTSHKVMIKVGSCSNASPMVERINEWSGNRGLSLANPDVVWWQMRAAQPRKAVKLSEAEMRSLAKQCDEGGEDNEYLLALSNAIQDAFIAKNRWAE